MLAIYEQYGTVTPPLACQSSHLRELEHGDVDFLHSHLSANPSLYLDKLQERLHDS